MRPHISDLALSLMRPVGAPVLRTKSSKIEWEDAEVTTWEPLTIIAKCNPVTCAVYAKENGLLNDTGPGERVPGELPSHGCDSVNVSGHTIPAMLCGNQCVVLFDMEPTEIEVLD